MELQSIGQVIGAAVAGTLLSIGIAKAYLVKSLKDLEAAVSMCHEINAKLAGITVKLDRFSEVERVVNEMDRKIISLEARKSDKRSRGAGGARMRAAGDKKRRPDSSNH